MEGPAARPEQRCDLLTPDPLPSGVLSPTVRPAAVSGSGPPHTSAPGGRAVGELPGPLLPFTRLRLARHPQTRLFASTLSFFLLLSHTLSVHRRQVERKTRGADASALARRDFLKKIRRSTELFWRLPIYIYHLPYAAS